ncbi:alpha/beta hydrolase [Rhodococcus sp. NCIMB 12038]|uniref:alpha/beta hydrolase n=1 Tax=Rhodococcus sp. NCIMB 12038 TaxID=933800 RepID=UPI000B3D052E|nr:hypothetical protein [Rhodococcus sp. NCIMB 12038]OUS91384.1 hypothetical protein CA951_33565 [Rhodococcus sp. NCIMB 12038]
MAHNKHLDNEPVRWGADSDTALGVVLAVHGRGQSPAYMQEQAARLETRDWHFFAPHAHADTWYPQSFLAAIDDNEPDLSMALDAIDHYLIALQAAGFGPERIVVWGFSQGACLLAHHLLTRSTPVTAAILCTGGYLGPDRLDPAIGSLSGISTVLRSIENDPFVPSHRVDDTATLLRLAGASVNCRIDPGDEHVISDEAIDTAKLLMQLISTATSPAT